MYGEYGEYGEYTEYTMYLPSFGLLTKASTISVASGGESEK
jgi:hypothetical protein